jgi:hypothetical protein
MGRPQGSLDLLPFFIREQLDLSTEQRKQLDAFEKVLGGKFDKLLTESQRKQVRDITPVGPGGFAALPMPGEVLSKATLAALKPAEAQRKQLDDLQKEVDGKLETLLSADQKKHLAEARAGFARGGPFGVGPPGGPGGPGGRPGFGPGGRMMGNTLFRAHRYAPDYPGLASRDLKPGKLIEELQDSKKRDEPKQK